MARHTSASLMIAAVAALGLQACASGGATSSTEAADNSSGKAYVTGSRLPYKVGTNLGTEHVKGVSRQGFKDDMNEHKMPVSPGN